MSGPSFILAGRGARAAAVTLCAGTLALAAGCSPGTTSSSGGAAAKAPSPRTALLLAAQQSEHLDTLAASSTVQTNGSQTLASTVLVRYKPTLLVETTANLVVSGQQLNMSEIVSSKAIYLKMAPLAKEIGKPWGEIPFSKLNGKLGALFSQLLQDVQNSDPQQQAKMLTASQNVRQVGTSVIDGVSTTEYAGTYTAASALAVLSPSQRKVLGPELKQFTGAIHFSDWIDTQHHMRKTVVTETVSGHQIVVTTNITAINQPLNIKLPPRRKVAVMPAGSLG